MPITQTISVENGIIGLYQMTESFEELEILYFDTFQHLAPISEFRNDRRKREWLAVRLLIAKLAGTDFTIQYSVEGKPIFLHSEYKYISISHSEQYAAVYLHKSQNIGIDIESLNRKFLAIEKKYLSDIELQHVKAHETLPAIYWCCKEAIFKFADKPGVDFREHIEIEYFDPMKTSTICATLKLQSNRSITLQYLFIDHNVLVYTS